jgi:hypothetical protein
MRAIGKVALHLSIQVLAPVALLLAAAAWVGLGLPFSQFHFALLGVLLLVLGGNYIRQRNAKRHG